LLTRVRPLSFDSVSSRAPCSGLSKTVAAVLAVQPRGRNWRKPLARRVGERGSWCHLSCDAITLGSTATALRSWSGARAFKQPSQALVRNERATDTWHTHGTKPSILEESPNRSRAEAAKRAGFGNRYRDWIAAVLSFNRVHCKPSLFVAMARYHSHIRGPVRGRISGAK
jgi:hypothetical protein